MEGDVITLQDIYSFKVHSVAPDRTITGALEPTGLRPIFQSKFEKPGIELPTDIFRTTVQLANAARGVSAGR